MSRPFRPPLANSPPLSEGRKGGVVLLGFGGVLCPGRGICSIQSLGTPLFNYYTMRYFFRKSHSTVKPSTMVE